MNRELFFTEISSRDLKKVCNTTLTLLSELGISIAIYAFVAFDTCRSRRAWIVIAAEDKPM